MIQDAKHFKTHSLGTLNIYRNFIKYRIHVISLILYSLWAPLEIAPQIQCLYANFGAYTSHYSEARQYFVLNSLSLSLVSGYKISSLASNKKRNSSDEKCHKCTVYPRVFCTLCLVCRLFFMISWRRQTLVTLSLVFMDYSNSLNRHRNSSSAGPLKSRPSKFIPGFCDTERRCMLEFLLLVYFSTLA